MEPQDINYLINKYSKTPNHRNEELHLSNFSQRSSFSPIREPNSKAYAAAMRALQDRINFLESENSELYNNYKSSELRLKEAQELNDKLSYQMTDLSSSERKISQTAAELKQELARTQREAQSLQNQIRRLETKDLEGLSQENLQLKREIDGIMRELADGKSRELNQSMSLQKLQDEKNLLQDELGKQKWMNKEIEGENERARRGLNESRRAEEDVEVLRAQNHELIRTLQDLENKSRQLENHSPSPKTSRKGASSPKKSVSFRKSQSKSKASKSTSPSSPRLSRPQNRHKGAHLVEYGDYGERILRMEEEMNQLHNKYRRLVSSSKSDSNGLERLKQDIGGLANELHSKSSILKKLKSDQISGMSFSRDFVTN